ncbi:MAG TPA: hypothetical protein VFQ72_03670 [Candidatus Paceibacterota bacterium]|nr:hypothetical protein [Candidatus Paceibacterota bacterium]
MKKTQGGFALQLLVTIVAILIVVGGAYYLAQRKGEKSNSALESTSINSDQVSDQNKVIDPLYTFSLPSGWQAGPRGGAQTVTGDGLVAVYPGSGSIFTGVTTLDQQSIDAEKAMLAKSNPGSTINSEFTTVGGEKAVIVSFQGSQDGKTFFWSSTLLMHDGILYTIVFNSTGSMSRATADFQKIIHSFKFTSSSTISNASPNDPAIYSVVPASGPVGTAINIEGKNLNGFEGDLAVIFERSDGKKVTLYDDAKYPKTGGNLINVTVKEPCQPGQTVYGRYSGNSSVCDYVALTPGVYKVYARPYSTSSNIMTFTITK